MAGLRESHSPRRTDEKRSAEFLLETLQPRRQGRLREEQLLGRLPHAALAGDCGEAGDVRQEHDL
jgi:hypothetical protein